VLTVEQMNAIAGRVTYKPGWSFEFRMGAHEGHHATIRTQLPDADDPGKTVPLTFECFLSPNDVADEESLIRWLAYRLGRIEIHESREFLRVDGRVVSDPHAEGADADR
jgi:hypothetical protein